MDLYKWSRYLLDFVFGPFKYVGSKAIFNPYLNVLSTKRKGPLVYNFLYKKYFKKVKLIYGSM